MRFMVLVKASDESEAGEMPTREMVDEMGKFNDEMTRANVMRAGEGLYPSSDGVRIAWKNGKKMVTDGPFAETKELVAGYWIIEVESKAKALEWMERAPFTQETIEIRRIFEEADFEEQMRKGGGR